MKTGENTPTTSAMSFNIRGSGREADGINHWSRRKGLAVHVIKGADPDTIGFQEAQYGNLATFYDTLRSTYHHILGLNMDDGNFNPIFWKKDRYQLDTAGGIWLHPNQTPNAIATKWGAAAIRCANWAVFKDTASGQQVARINTHLDHIGERARYESARLILAKWQEIGKDIPTIITADFNSGTHVPPGVERVNYTDAALRVFLQAGFVDVYAQTHADNEKSNTFHNFEGDNYNPAHSHGLWQVDYVLVKGFNVVAGEIIRDAKPPLYPSDHYPKLGVLSE